MSNIVSSVKSSAIPDSTYPRMVLGWASEAIQESEAFLKAQDGYNRISESIDAVMGKFERPLSTKLSEISCNRTGKVSTVLTSGLTDIKPFWEFRTKNPRFQHQAQIEGVLSKHWWLNRAIDTKFATAIQYYQVAGTGWMHHIGWVPDLNDFDCIAEDPRDILPIRPSSNISIQDAFGVIVRRERTVNYIKGLWPDAGRFVKADRDGSVSDMLSNTRAGLLLAAINRSISPFQAYMDSREPHNRIPKIPTADLFTCYVKDDSINKGKMDVLMGALPGRKPEEQPNWTYLVKPGDRLYPRKRLIIFTRSAILYDGPNPFWHGLFPLNKLTLDPFLNSWLGRAPLWDILVLQKSLNKTLRAVDDHIERCAEPGVAADKNAMGKHGLGKINTRLPGMHATYNSMAGKPFEMIHEPPLDSAFVPYIEYLEAKMDELSGARDLSQMMQLGQLPSAETVDKMIESMSPPNRLRSRYAEAFMREFALMIASNFAQFYTDSMRLAIAGPDGLTPEDFDFDPGTFIPAYLHESDLDSQGNPTADALARGPLSRAERAQYFLKYFTFHIAPASLLASSEISTKLLYVQLFRMGAMDLETMLEKLDVPNIQQIMQRLQAAAASGMMPLVGPAGASASGRKATAQAPPHMISRPNGSATISES